jgi:hypothetical protein
LKNTDKQDETIPDELIQLCIKVFGIDPDSLNEERTDDSNDAELFYEKNPATGGRYDIPMLLPSDPDYVEKYIRLMKIKKENPGLFNKILNWD